MILLTQELLLSSALIVALSLPSVLLRRLLKDPSPQAGSPSKAQQPRPLGFDLLLLLSPALEYPFMLALHPITLAFPTASQSGIPGPVELLQQIGVLLAVEMLFRVVAGHVVSLSVDGAAAQVPGTGSKCAASSEPDPDDEVLSGLAVDFMSPRAALLLGTAAVALISGSGNQVGALHPLAMIVWVVFGQTGALQNLWDAERMRAFPSIKTQRLAEVSQDPKKLFWKSCA